MQATSRKEQKEKTRLGLVRTAEDLFSRRGIAITTTAEVANAMEVSHGTVFVHFPTREDLVLAVVEKFGERISDELGRRVSEEQSLRQMLKNHVEVVSEFEDFYMRLISESQSLPKGIRSVLYSLNSFLSYRFFAAAKKLMKTGELKKFDQPTFFNTWLALVHFQVMNRDLFSEKRPILAHVGDELVRQFFHLIKAT